MAKRAASPTAACYTDDSEESCGFTWEQVGACCFGSCDAAVLPAAHSAATALWLLVWCSAPPQVPPSQAPSTRAELQRRGASRTLLTGAFQSCAAPEHGRPERLRPRARAARGAQLRVHREPRAAAVPAGGARAGRRQLEPLAVGPAQWLRGRGPADRALAAHWRVL